MLRFSESARQLEAESRLVAENFSVCDSTSLLSVVCQYEQWYVDKVRDYSVLVRAVVRG